VLVPQRMLSGGSWLGFALVLSQVLFNAAQATFLTEPTIVKANGECFVKSKFMEIGFHAVSEKNRLGAAGERPHIQHNFADWFIWHGKQSTIVSQFQFTNGGQSFVELRTWLHCRLR